MVIAPIPKELAERLNALMRPADNVSPYAVAAGILKAVSGESSTNGCIAALAYAFTNLRFAHLSGPETPAAAYPPVLDSGGCDRAAFSDSLPDGLVAQLCALGERLSADRADTTECARHAWGFLQTECKTSELRIIILSAMIFSPNLPFVRPTVSVREPPRFDVILADAEYKAVLWKHRTVLVEVGDLFEARRKEQIETNTGFAGALWSALSRIKDERERAIVFGRVIADSILDNDVHAVRAMLGAVLHKMPCRAACGCCGEPPLSPKAQA